MLTWYKTLTVRRPIIGTERRRPVRARQRLVIRRQEVFLAERRRQLAQFELCELATNDCTEPFAETTV